MHSRRALPAPALYRPTLPALLLSARPASLDASLPTRRSFGSSGMGQRFTAPADRGAGRADGRLGLTAAEAELALEERLEANSDRLRHAQTAVARLLTHGPSPEAVRRVHSMIEEIDDEVVELLLDVDYTHLVPDPVPAAYERRT